METTNKNPVWGMSDKHMLIIGLIATVLIVLGVGVALVNFGTTVPNACSNVCKLSRELSRVKSENIDLRAKVVGVEQQLKEKNPPDSRHFYDCRPAAKNSDWNLAVYSHTMNKLYAWRCESWHGHTSLQHALPEEKQKKLTCSDQQGTRPYVN